VFPKAREDICSECFDLAHMFHHFAANPQIKQGPNEFETRETAVKVAQLHCEHANAQRLYFNECAERLAVNELDDCLVMDFAQNLALPYLGNEQSGAMYYYPLNIFAFGVVNMRTDLLHVFVCCEQCCVYDIEISKATWLLQ